MAVGADIAQPLAFASSLAIISSDNIVVSVIDEHAADHGELFGEPVTSLEEGQTIHLDGVFDDVDEDDERVVEIDWGDGSPITV